MDKTISYVEKFTFKQEPKEPKEPKEQDKVDYLTKLEQLYGTNVSGEGFAVEKYEEKKQFKTNL